MTLILHNFRVCDLNLKTSKDPGTWGQPEILPPIAKPTVSVAQVHIPTMNNTVEKDAKQIEKAVRAAKHGEWEEVWKIIGSPNNPKRSIYLNCIPETRRWGILHQGVWWNNEHVIRKLLSYDTCDTNIRAKESMCEEGLASGKFPHEIADDFNYENIGSILKNHYCNISDQDIETFQPYQPNVENEALGLFRLTLASYKKAFHPEKVHPSKSLTTILQDVFTGMNSSSTRWTRIRDAVCDSIRYLNPDCNAAIERLNTCATLDDFFETIINTYTTEENKLYTLLNTALRRQTRENYRPTASDLSLGPYILVYQMLLMFWVLEHEKRTTYRKMVLNCEDLQRYQVGTQFIWSSFVSSSVAKEKAQPFPTIGPIGQHRVLFIINNQCKSEWRPRNIERYAQYHENERVYPAGATFEVTHRTQIGGETCINLKLC